MPICKQCLKTKPQVEMGSLRRCKACAKLDYEIRKLKLRRKTVAYKTSLIDTAVKIHRKYKDRIRHKLFPGDKAAISAIYRQSIYLRRMGMNVNVDHIIPIKGNRICGLHVSWNLRILTMMENSEKGHRINLAEESERLFDELVLKGLATRAK
jgi:5-methylcytosine-specific restriction endonuclease McrA